MGFLPLFPPCDEKVLLFRFFIKKRWERRDQHRLMKGISLKCAATAKTKKKKKGKEELHLISVQHHHSPTFYFCLSSSLLLPLTSGDITVELHEP